jgi:PhnB protein
MKTNYKPEGCHSITPYLTVPDAGRLIDFLKLAFDGVEHARLMGPNGRIAHAQVRIGDSLVMLGEPVPPWSPRTNMLYLYVPDVDATYRQALKAGAKSVIEPANMFYGDRHACVTDVADNTWWIATHLEDMSMEELQKRAMAFHAEKAKAAGA